MSVDRGDQIVRTYSPVAEDIDEALCNMDAEIAKLRAEVGRLEKDVKEARDFAIALHKQSRVVTCVYCGQAYPQDTPAHGAGVSVLTEHIKTCSKHPMRELEQQLAQLRELAKGILAGDSHERLVFQAKKALSAQPAPLGNCTCGKPATVDFADIPMCSECRVKISEAMERRDKDVLRILDRAAQPAPQMHGPEYYSPTCPCEKCQELKALAAKHPKRLTPHGRVIHEKGTIDVSGFPYPPETLDNEPAELPELTAEEKRACDAFDIKRITGKPVAPNHRGCNVCGAKLTTIRGRFPNSPDRMACATCLQERMESIHDESGPDYGVAQCEKPAEPAGGGK